MFDRLTQSGVRVLVVAGSEDADRLRRGEERHYDSLTRTGTFRLESIPNLEHTLLERTGREQVSQFLHAWVFGTGTDTADPVLPGASKSK